MHSITDWMRSENPNHLTAGITRSQAVWVDLLYILFSDKVLSILFQSQGRCDLLDKNGKFFLAIVRLTDKKSWQSLQAL